VFGTPRHSAVDLVEQLYTTPVMVVQESDEVEGEKMTENDKDIISWCDDRWEEEENML